ncbi:MAG: DUF3747 domain-containing protein, partial [Cyanobacteria bacterium J06559_1]
MKSLQLTLAALATAAIAATAPVALAQMEDMPAEQMPVSEPTLPSDTPVQNTPVPTQANSSLFGMNETSQDPYILVAQPTSRLGGRQRYGLMIIEQKREEPLCYSTTGSSPTQVDILLLNFDFSGICGKSTDTNGYLIRAAGEDLAFDPVIENEDGVLVLYASPRRSAPEGAERFVIGQTDGIAANGFTQIFMKPGWRLTRQTYNDSVTGRTYIANDLTLAALSGQDVAIEPGGGDQSGGGVVTPPPSGAPAFPDVVGDTYAGEINRAVQLGFIDGFAEDRTFRPQASLTREQLVSIVVEGLEVAPQGSVSSNPFPDVPSDRWSAAKIKTAQDLGIVTGYENGTFRPTQEVTRAELIAIMRRAAEYKNSTTTLVANQTGDSFTDINGHWAEDTISGLSEFCGVASPLNEVGN